MSQQTIDAGVREALVELQRYLSDELAPMMVTEAVELLLKQSPTLVANEIQAWVGNQVSRHGSYTVSDCLFHSIKKIHLVSEFDLVGDETLQDYIGELTELVLQICPEADRDYLRENISRLGQSEAGNVASAVEVIYTQGSRAGSAPTHAARAAAAQAAAAPGAVMFPAGVAAAASAASAAAGEAGTPAGAPAGGVAPGSPIASAPVVAHPAAPVSAELAAEMARGLKRFGLLMERLGRAPADGDDADQRDPVVPQAITAAATSARSTEELEAHLQKIRHAGVETGMGDVFRALGRSLPGWAVPNEGASQVLAGNRSVHAMHRLISMAANPEEGARRFTEMMDAAIERFNDGALGQAVTMFELAERIIGERQLSLDVVTSIRQKAHEPIDRGKLKSFADQPEKHLPLRKVLDFFPALTPRGLLEALRGEPRRDRRRLQLALLEVHGPAARREVLARLASHAESTDPKGYFLRNLVYLLRRIPRPEEMTAEAELSMIVPLADWSQPILVIKESIAALGTYSEKIAQETLISRLSELEEMLLNAEALPCGADEMRGLLDRAASALARSDSKPSILRLVDHALKRKPQLGNTLSRLEELGDRDLGAHRGAVDQLLAALRAELPSKVLGFVVNKRPDAALHILHAFALTPLPPVREMLESIVSRFDDEELGQAAARILAGFGVASRDQEERGRTMTGDVELFGLPNLMQSFSDSSVTGVLTLNDADGDLLGTICFDGGKIVDCRQGLRRGADAFYQLFERPQPGTFAFRGRKLTPQDVEGARGEPLEVLPGLMEAMRRHDEYQAARALVPDGTLLEKGDAKPTIPDDEEDRDFIRRVWVKATSGATPAEAEEAIPVDGFRIRRLYAHWIEGGALRVKAA